MPQPSTYLHGRQSVGVAGMAVGGGHHPRCGPGGEVLVNDAVSEVARGLGGSPAATLPPVPARRAGRGVENRERREGQGETEEHGESGGTVSGKLRETCKDAQQERTSGKGQRHEE